MIFPAYVLPYKNSKAGGRKSLGFTKPGALKYGFYYGNLALSISPREICSGSASLWSLLFLSLQTKVWMQGEEIVF